MSQYWAEVIKIFLFLFVLSDLSLAVYGNRKKLNIAWNVWREFRFLMFLESIGIITVAIALIVFLSKISILNFGWMNLILKGGGNFIVSVASEGLNSSSFLLRLGVPLFFFLLLLILPFLTKAEEEAFRKGLLTWNRIIPRSIKFGFVHMFMGVSISAAIVLSFIGLFYAYKYRKKYLSLVNKVGGEEADQRAILESTTYHTMTNSILVILMIVFSFLYV